VWSATLPAGLLGMAATLALLAMQSMVAGVAEESAFRGYMQRMVGRRHGVVAGIVAAPYFGLLHHPAVRGHGMVVRARASRHLERSGIMV